jgi:hypothetical protein
MSIPLPALSIRPYEQADPLSQYAKAVSLKNLLGQGQIQQGAQQLQQQQIVGETQQNQQRAQQMQDQQTAMQVIGANNGDIGKSIPQLAGKVSPLTLQALQKAHADAVKSAGERTKLENENEATANGNLVGLIEQAKQLPPEQYAQQFPQIAARALEIQPKLKDHIDPAQPIPQDQLGQLSIGFMSQAQIHAQVAAKQSADAATEAVRHNKAMETKDSSLSETELALKAAGGDADAKKALDLLAKQKSAGRTVLNPGIDTAAKDIADEIESGDQQPVMTGLYRYAGPVRAELARRGYPLAQATSDWTATQKHLSTLNGAQQERLRQAISFTSDSTDIIDNLYNEWQRVGPASGIKVLNKAGLAAAKQLPGKPGEVATALEAQINDLVSELGTVYKGGNSSTDESLKLAAGNLKADWNEQTFKRALGLIRTNLKIRKNSMNTQPAGVSGGSTYTPQMETNAAPASKPLTITLPSGKKVTID